MAGETHGRGGGRPGIVGMQIGKGGESGSRFHFSQPIEPQRKPCPHMFLKLSQAKREEQVPRDERIKPKMDQGMRLHADSMEDAGNMPCEGGG